MMKNKRKQRRTFIINKKKDKERRGGRMLLGIDVGTTGAKAMLFAPDGKALGYAFQEYGIQYTKEGYAQQDAEKVWEITKRVIQKAVKEAAMPIKAVSLSVQGDAVIAVDRNRHAISSAHLGMDYRGQEEARQCGEDLGEKWIFQKTGMRPHPMNFFIKILWIQKHDPNLYERTWKFVTYADFLLGKLGSDDIVVDYTMASRTQAFELKEKVWSKEILGAYGISEEKLGRPVPSGTVVGKIRRELAEELGISQDALLVAGGHDQVCAAIGAGITYKGMALDSHGTAEVLSTVLEEPKLNDVMFKGYYPCYIHGLPGQYFTFALNHTGGGLLKWFVEGFCQKDRELAEKGGGEVYDYLISRMPEGVAPVVVLPYLNGSGTPACDLEMKGGILGLTMATDRFDIGKGILEALAFEMRWNLAEMRKAGVQITDIRCVGGGARSSEGLQLKADIMGVPVASLKIREAACFGAAILAGKGLEIYRGIKEVGGLVQVKEIFEPCLPRHKAYESRYHLYRELYDSLRQAMYDLT